MTRSPARALAVLAPLLVALVPLPASAGTATSGAAAGASPAGLAARAFADRPAASEAHASAASEGTATASDPAGDARDDRGDITGLDVTYDPATVLRLHADVVQTTDPDTDPAWNRQTGLVWALDTDGDGEPDFGVALAKQGVAVVDRNGAVMCAGPRSGGTLSTSGEPAGSGRVQASATQPSGYTISLPARCVGGPAHVAFGAVMLYEVGNGGSGDVVSVDVAPDQNKPLAGPVLPRGGVSPDTQGYWLVGRDGGIFSFNAPFAGSTGNIHLNAPIVTMAAMPDGTGYWLVASDGGVFAFGNARFFGSLGGTHLNRPIVGAVAAPDGQGYWMVASDGGVFAFGSAAFFGSTGGMRLNKPIVSMAAARGGQGYWLVAADGGIFAFGSAPFFGSVGDRQLTAPIVSLLTTNIAGGYYEIGADGAVFAFGDAPLYGSLSTNGVSSINKPIVGASMSRAGAGYRFVASDGGVFNFGDATFNGSTGAMKLNQPVVGLGLG